MMLAALDLGFPCLHHFYDVYPFYIAFFNSYA